MGERDIHVQGFDVISAERIAQQVLLASLRS